MDGDKGFFISGVYQLTAYNLVCPFPDVVHPTNPLHLVLLFKLLGDAFTFFHLLYESVKHITCLFVNVGKVGVESEVTPSTLPT